tara:strand:+ start:302 stop:547 length:246 start_codon:yes stop_codon:yes gene_type:complete
MTKLLKTTKRNELETLASKAYNETKEDDGMHRGFSSAEVETEDGKLECRATPSQSRINTTGEWFSFRYYLNGKATAKKNLK